MRTKLPEGYKIQSYCYDGGTGMGDDRYDWGLWEYVLTDVVVGRRWFKKIYAREYAWELVTHNQDKAHLVWFAQLHNKKKREKR